MAVRCSTRSLVIARGSARRAPWLASLLVALQLATFGHMLLVPHAVASDGALVHLGRAHAGARARGNPRLGPCDLHDSDGGRDLCVVASGQSQNPGARACSSQSLQDAPRAILLSRHSDRRPDAARVACYRLAPKQSPPA